MKMGASTSRSSCLPLIWQLVALRRKDCAGPSKCTTKTDQVKLEKLTEYYAIFYAGCIELEEMVEIILTLYELNGFPVVSVSNIDAVLQCWFAGPGQGGRGEAVLPAGRGTDRENLRGEIPVRLPCRHRPCQDHHAYIKPLVFYWRSSHARLFLSLSSRVKWKKNDQPLNLGDFI